MQQKQTPQPVNEVSKIRRFRCFTCSASGIETRFSSKFTVFKPSDGKHLIFLCGSGSHANFEKLCVAAGMYVKGHTELVSARGEHFDCPGRVARRIFELYTAVWDKYICHVQVKIRNIVCPMQSNTGCALPFSTNEFLKNRLP